MDAEDGPGYLRYLPAQPEAGGMSHWLANLQCLLREALKLGRLAVLPPLGLSRRHNFGIARDWRWETYFDVGGGCLVAADGAALPLPVVARATGHTAPVLRVASGAPAPGHGPARTTVERRVGPLYGEHVPSAGLAAATLRLPPSSAVLALARPVVARLASPAGGYVAVHVRRGDRMRWRRRWRAGTSPERIRAMLHAQGVAANVPVFFLSDERDPVFWAALRDDCRLYRHTDFAALAALVDRAGRDAPDNYLLYEAEVEIMRHARLRIGTVAGRGRVAADAWLLEPDVLDAPARRLGDSVRAWTRFLPRP